MWMPGSPLAELSTHRSDRSAACGTLRIQSASLGGPRSADMVHRVRALMDDYGSIEFASEFAEGILLVAEAYFEQAFTHAKPGPDLDFLRALVPYVWARWR
jgi:geranylgeranyl diphosphate synthase, type II